MPVVTALVHDNISYIALCSLIFRIIGINTISLRIPCFCTH